ncbi:MAG: xanthine dehydrogenase [Chloroflexi bacterium]|nr:MAG: xanthine dehydrogenase [Chloroflexota bacterium]
MQKTIYTRLRDAITREVPVAVATVITGDDVGAQVLIQPDQAVISMLNDTALVEQIHQDALAMLLAGEQGIRIYGERQIFIETYPPPATIIMVGAVHIAVALTTFAKPLGFRTIVVDARGAFATGERFGHADELVHAWPDEALQGRLHSNTAVVVLTHDPKLDDPALLVALPSAARYVGALGSTKTQAARVLRLRDAGLNDAQIGRLYAPIGLPIGGRTPEEIGLSIMAQIVAVRNGKI